MRGEVDHSIEYKDDYFIAVYCRAYKPPDQPLPYTISWILVMN